MKICTILGFIKTELQQISVDLKESYSLSTFPIRFLRSFNFPCEILWFLHGKFQLFLLFWRYLVRSSFWKSIRRMKIVFLFCYERTHLNELYSLWIEIKRLLRDKEFKGKDCYWQGSPFYLLAQFVVSSLTWHIYQIQLFVHTLRRQKLLILAISSWCNKKSQIDIYLWTRIYWIVFVSCFESNLFIPNWVAVDILF